MYERKALMVSLILKVTIIILLFMMRRRMGAASDKKKKGKSRKMIITDFGKYTSAGLGSGCPASHMLPLRPPPNY